MVIACALWACGDQRTQRYEQPPPQLIATPSALAFVCVAPGCSTVQATRIKVTGERDFAVKRIDLDHGGEAGFTVSPELLPPFILGVGQSFEVAVRYEPGPNLNFPEERLLITYSDASNDESDPDRVEPGEIRIPLIPRLIGEPVLGATPAALKFDPVEVGNSQMLSVEIVNIGTGNIPVGVADAVVTDASFGVTSFMPTTLATGDSLRVDVTFAPIATAYTSAALVVTPADPTLPVLEVALVATSILQPAIDVSDTLDFGTLAIRDVHETLLNIHNRGGADLIINSAVSPSPDVSVAFPDEQVQLTVAPLDSVDVTVRWQPTTAGPFDDVLVLNSNAPATPSRVLDLVGFVEDPRIEVTPAAIDFGTVFLGWTVTETVTIRNIGYGPLEIERILSIFGSSDLYTITPSAILPLTLEHGESTTFEVEFRANSPATFEATVSIDSSDVATPFVELPVIAVVDNDCTSVCNLPNATTTCDGQTCVINSCAANWFNIDQSPHNGCECEEVGGDVPNFCTQINSIPTVIDTVNDNSGLCHTGVLPYAGDVDWIRFQAVDNLGSGNDTVDIRLRTDDPGVRMCVFRHATSQAPEPGVCYTTPSADTSLVCPSDGIYTRPGTSADDDAEYAVKIERTTAALTCTPYEVAVDMGDTLDPCGP